jgi:hypothetical protein
MVPRFADEGREDRLANARFVVENFAEGEAQDAEAARFQIVISERVVMSCDVRPVRASIDFDHKLGMKACEISVVRSELDLLAKVVAVGTEGMQKAPHAEL